MKKAKIALEDGRIFNGYSFGAEGEKSGEVVFNTGMTGYQEVLTDPSYKGQLVTMTYPLIGNYGINSKDVESRRIFLEGFIVKENSRIASNWSHEKTLSQYLKQNKVIGIEGVDTRALTRHIRLKGAMKAVISTKNLDDRRLVRKAKESAGLVGIDLVKEVTLSKTYSYNDEGRFGVVAVDCGIKLNILRELAAAGCRVTVVPPDTDYKEMLSHKPDGLFLSNGPGDPQAVGYLVATVKKLIGKFPFSGYASGTRCSALRLAAALTN